MPYNGSGVYAAPANSWNPAIGGTTISSADWNSLLSDLETALSSVITKDGQTTVTANLPMAGFKHTGVNTNSGSTSRSEYTSGATAQDNVIQDAGVTAGSSTVYTATLAPAIAAYADKACYRVQFDEACGANPTINFNSVGAKKIYKNVSGTATQLVASDVTANFIAILRYDAALDTAAGGFWLVNSAFTLVDNIITAANLAASAIGCPVNLGLVSSVGSNALTVAIKGEDGTDPSATNVVKIPFQDQAGNYDVLSITAATSIVVSSGSTLGTANGVARRLWIVGFNDSGTFRLGIVNCYISIGNIFALVPYNTYSSTAEGGAGAADSAGVIYTGTAVTTKPMVILGFAEATEATAGTWATAPSRTMIWKPFMKLPGNTVRPWFAQKTDTQQQTTETFTDITGLSIAATPTSDCNVFEVQAIVQYGAASGTNYPTFRLMRDAVPIGIGDLAGSRLQASIGTGAIVSPATMATGTTLTWDAPATTSATTYKLQRASGAAGAAGDTWVNRSNNDTDNADYQRTQSSITAKEIMT
jgi:hypothetical protein